MRMCSVQHAAWSTHKRVGGLPKHRLRRVHAPDFGVELCDIAIAESGLTPHPHWSYESTDVHCWVGASINKWWPQTYTLMCLTQGERASEWTKTTLHAVEGPTKPSSA